MRSLDSWTDFIEFFFDWDNPVFYTILFTLIILGFLITLTRYYILPLIRRHRKEIKNLEQQHLENMALFSELNPDPLMRFDLNGKLISYNKVVTEIFGSKDLTNFMLNDLVDEQIQRPNEIIENDQTINFVKNFSGRTYSLRLSGLKKMQLIHLFMHDITDRIEYEKKLEQNNKQIREISIRNEKIKDDESRRIAGDLHDSVGQNLNYAKMKLNMLTENGSGIIENGNVQELDTILDNVINEIREICYQLKPRALDELGIVGATIQIVDRINESGKINGCVKSNSTITMSADEQLILFRVIQEAINNIIKHSGAKIFEIQFLKGSDSLRVMIYDDGNGFDQEELKKQNRPNLGLFNMQERIKGIQGKLKITSAPGDGTVILIEFKQEDLKWVIEILES